MSRLHIHFTRRHAAVALVALLLGWVALVTTGVGQQFPNDFSAFYSAARGLRIHGLGLTADLYSLHVQLALESFFHSPQGFLSVPFVNPPVAAWILIPISWMPLRTAFLVFDALGLAATLGGLAWLARLPPRPGRLGILVLALASAYPVYLTLGQGQFDLLWPLGAALLASAFQEKAPIRYAPRAAVAALMVAIKPDLFLGLAVPAVREWRRPQIRWLVGAATLLGLATVVILGPGGLASAVRIEQYTIVHRFPPSLDMTVTGFLWRLVGPSPWDGYLGLAAIPVGIAVLAVGFWRRPPRTSADWAFAITTATCVSLLIAPHDLVQGMLLLGGPAVLVGRTLRQQGRSLLPLGLAIAALDLCTLIDLSPHLHLPLRLTVLLLLGLAVVSWRARGWVTQAVGANEISLEGVIV